MNNDMIEAAKRGRAQHLRQLEAQKRRRKLARAVKSDSRKSSLDTLVSRLDDRMKNDDFNGFVRILMSTKL